MANPLNVAIKVTGLDQAKADLASFATIGKRSFNEIANEAKNFAQSAATTDPALRGVANRVRQLAAATDDAFASNLKLRQSISDVERALRAEMVSAESAARMTAALRAEHEKLAISTKAVVGEIRQLETIGKISYGGITAMAQRAASAIKPTAQSTHDLAVAMKELSLAADPAAAAQMRLLNGLTQVKAALDQKIISTQQAIRLEQYLREQSQATARAEAELANKVRDAAIARAQASIQAANAQKAASQITIASVQAEIQQINALRQKSFSDVVKATPSGGRGPVSGSQDEAALATQMRGLVAKADPIGAANLELQSTILAVNRARKKDMFDKEQEARIIQYLQVEHEKYIASLNKEAAAHRTNATHVNTSAQSMSKLTSGMTQLSFQINDIGTSLVSGASPFMVLAQQGGQIFQVFQMFPGLLAKVAALLVNPFVLAAIAITSVTTALAALVIGAGNRAQELKEFGVSLEGVGRSALATTDNLVAMSKQLRDIGVARKEANDIAKSIARNPEINPAFGKEILSTGTDVAARLGVTTKEGIDQVTAALTQNADAVIKLGIATGALNQQQVTNLVTMARTGQEMKARNEAFKLLQAGTNGAADRVRSEWEKAFNALGTAWDNFILKLQDTKFVKHLSEVFKQQLNEITSFLDTISKWMESKGGPSLPAPGVAPATGGRVGAAGPGGFTGYGGTVPVTTIVDAGARLTPEEIKVSVDMDPRAIGLFELTKQVTGELGVRVTPHGFTTGGHVANSMHYPTNTSSGLGQAIDYVFPGQRYNDAPPGSEMAARHQRFNETFARLAREQYGITADQGQYFNPYDPGHVAARGLPPIPGRVAASVAAASSPDLEAQRARAYSSSAYGGATAAGGPALPDPLAVAKIAAELKAANEEARKSYEIAKSDAGPAKAATEAYWGAYLPALAQGKERLDAHNLATVAAAKAGNLYQVELQRGYTAEQLSIDGERSFATALQTSEAAANQAAAASTARQEVFQKGGNLGEIQERKYQAALAQTFTALQRTQNDNKRRVEVLQLENELSGQTSETINYQVSLLQAKQKLQESGVDLTSKEGQAYMKSAEALAKATAQHAEIARQQQKQDDMWRQIGSTIETAIGNVIDGIFDPKKAIDWGKQIKSMMTGLFKDVTMSLFVKPMIGSALGALGASPNVVQGFGGSVAGPGGISVGGGLFGGSGGLFKELGIDSGTGGGLFSGTTGFMNKSVGGLFGTVQSEGWIPGANGIWTNAATGATTDIAGVSNITPGLLGNTTLGTAIGSVGMGFTAGTMLNSLVGGKSTGGMIGSGVGALGGMALGSLIGMPWLGGLLGGAGGGLLGGMFGNSKPSNASSGANIDLSQFKITSGFSGGNQQIDQQVSQIGQSLQSFMDLLKTTGGSLAGNVLLQSGVNTGITVDSSLEGYSGRFNLGKDTEAATKVIEQALVKSITGVSEVMKTVLSQVGTDEDISKAITFANTYDKIKTAADEAFKSVEDGKDQIGPFGTAMEQINAIFADLTISATRFGLSLDPVNAALAEATKRLQGDFLDAIKSATNIATGTTYRNTVQTTIDDYLKSTREASDIGLGADKSVGDSLGNLFTAQMKEILSGLDETALKDVITQSFEGLDSLNPLIDSLAEAAIAQLNLAEATNAAADAAQRGSAAYQAIADLLNSLQVHTSFAQSPEDAITAANKTFFDLFNKASEGSLEAMEGLAGASQDYIDAIEQYYGSSPQGQTEVAMIEKGLQDLLDMNPALKPQDQQVVTNTLLTTLNTTTTQTSGMIATNTDLLGANNAAANTAIAENAQHAKDAVDANNKAAADTIAANKLASDAAIAANNAASVSVIAANTKASDAAIAANDQASIEAIAANDIAVASMVAANNAGAAAMVAANNDAAVSITAQNDLAAQAIIAQNDAAMLASIAANDVAAAGIVAQNTADSLAMIAANDNATLQVVTNANAATAAILAGASADATAIGLVTQGVGNQLSEVNTGLANSTIAAIWGSASSIITGLYNVMVSNETGTYGAANSIIAADNTYANSQVTATYGAASSIITGLYNVMTSDYAATYGAANSIIAAENVYANNQNIAIWGAANSIIASENIYANNQAIATWGAANSIVASENIYTNSLATAIWGAASSIIAAELTYANGNLWAITNTQFSNDQANASINNWLSSLHTLISNSDYAIYLQLVDMTALLQRLLDGSRLQQAY